MKNSRKINHKITAIFVFILLLSSCSKVLNDVEDLERYPAKGTFEDPITANAFLYNLYSRTLSGWPVNQGNYADESKGIVAEGWITTDNSTMKFWPYQSIRNINIFLQEMSNSSLSKDQKDPMIGQAKFLRAFLYFKMVYHHGGVPIIEVPQDINDDLKVKRNSTAECFDFIEKDLKEAELVLPNKYIGGDRGKIDKAIVKSFLGRVLMFKASPQFNPSNPYNNSFWQNAYTANKDAITFLDQNGYGLLEDFSKLFETKGHKENILSVVYVNPAKTNGRAEDAVRPLSESKNATGGDEPTWGMSLAFPMKDGKMPGDPNSKYSFDLQTYWKDRDPRFDATLVWNASIYELSGIKGRRQYTMGGIAKSMDAFGLTLQGENYSRTGLYTKKGIMEELPSTQVTLNDVDWPEIRYAEVLLNLAEAANETGKPAEAIAAIKEIRKRAGIENGIDNMYGLKSGMSRDEIRTAILNEKYVEFMFEGKRFWDLRRHRLLGKLNGMHKYGIMATKVNGRLQNEITTEDIAKANRFELLPENFTYEVVELITNGPKAMVMPDTYYFFPIQLSNINQNPNLEQNVGWGGNFDPTLK